jgi:zinc dependent phospholipase C
MPSVRFNLAWRQPRALVGQTGASPVRPARLAAPAVLLLLLAPALRGYSVLSHEAIVDAAWDGSIKDLLLKKFPGATPQQLRGARAYAYGGVVIQDMGYYPFGDHFFSNLAHYVRTGDFVRMLLDEARDLNEYAFALGALAHYAADNNGHPLAVNRVVPMLYPRLRAKYGDVVTFGDDPKAHVLTEFGFDVIEVAEGRYAPESYHNFVGFKVSKPLLDRAFKKTYGLDIRDVLFDEDLALGTYRRTAGKLIPQMTKVAWEKRKDEIQKSLPGITRRQFVYKLSRRSYEQEWGKEYEKPGLVAKLLGFLVSIIPKVGALQSLTFKPPTPQAERLFLESFKSTSERYRTYLGELRAGRLDLPDQDCDTGRSARSGEYDLADRTYVELLDRLAENKFKNLTPELRDNILAFFAVPHAPKVMEKHPERWLRTLRELDLLKTM